MYLSKDDQIVSSSLSHLLNNSSTLGKLFENIFKKKSCPFHELSSLISDPGAPSQPLHPDSKWSDVPILYTVFVALQDVTETMGPTVFIPKSNREEIHKQHASRLPITMDRFSGQMKAGDCVVMDSRTLHHGSANNDLEKNRRRRLLYFTIRNPEYGGAFPSNGSLFEGMTCSTGEFNIPQPNTPP
ncbi:hypothetical protein ScalyP_jg5183 [Parmales sp. scaly parma]|nr:hypothetical protein ScalyP_jg5183 [Parmales sp. scaly parma]